MQEEIEKCFLSGLEIPDGKKSVEHYYPKSLLPPRIYNIRENIVIACKILNNVKGNLRPCEWEDRKYELTLYAIKHYRMKYSNRRFLKDALENWKTYKINPCEHCVARKFEEYCVKSR